MHPQLLLPAPKHALHPLLRLLHRRLHPLQRLVPLPLLRPHDIQPLLKLLQLLVYARREAGERLELFGLVLLRLGADVEDVLVRDFDEVVELGGEFACFGGDFARVGRDGFDVGGEDCGLAFYYNASNFSTLRDATMKDNART